MAVRREGGQRKRRALGRTLRLRQRSRQTRSSSSCALSSAQTGREHTADADLMMRLLSLRREHTSLPARGGALPLAAEPHRLPAVAGVFPSLTEEPHRLAPVAGVFPPTEEEPHRTFPVAGVFPPEEEERRKEPSPVSSLLRKRSLTACRESQAVFPPETEEPHRQMPIGSRRCVPS